MTRKNTGVKAANTKSVGTTSEFIDYKTGKMITCLSQNEERFFYLLRWNDNVIDIQSQYELDNRLVDKVIAELTGYDPNYKPDPLPDNRKKLSSDFLITLRNGKNVAYQVKNSPNDISKPIEERRLKIESLYWKALGVEWQLVFGNRINRDYVTNIKHATKYYDKSKVHDKTSLFQHLVANKKVEIDMENGLVEWKQLATEYFEKHPKQLEVIHE